MYTWIIIPAELYSDGEVHENHLSAMKIARQARRARGTLDIMTYRGRIVGAEEAGEHVQKPYLTKAILALWLWGS